MSNRRQVERTRTVTTEHRVKFTADELRKRLRLPEEAELHIGSADPEAEVDPDEPELERIVATWTTTAVKEGA